MVAHSYIVLPPIVDTWFQFLFHSPPGVLFTFPSRYSFTIGHQVVFSFTQWSGQIPTEFHVLHGTWESSYYALLYIHLRDYHALRSSFPRTFCLYKHLTIQYHLNPAKSLFPRTATSDILHSTSFKLFPFRSPLLRESHSFSFPDAT